jgi:hypothetical protein
MALDRPSADEFEEFSHGHHEMGPELGQPPADGAAAEPEITETRTPAEYYRALRAAVDPLAHASDRTIEPADVRPRSAWDDVGAAIRPPLDALRIPPERATHILDGDATGGGHRHGTGSPGKTEFPAHWDDDTTVEIIVSAARSPDSAELQQNGRWKALGSRDDVELAIIVMPDGRIWSAYPLPGSPGVRQNPRTR